MASKLIPSRMPIGTVDGRPVFASPEFFRALGPVQTLLDGGGSTAASISNIPSGGISATNVQDALDELDTEKASNADLSAHITDVAGAHDASAISNIPAGGIAATNVQGALNELDADKEAAGTAAAAIVAHVALADPHSQYLTQTEADARYPLGSGTSTGTNTGDQTVREILTAARTYYVRTDGNDANTGLVNSAGGAFLTKQKAIDTISNTLDMGAYQVTIQIVDGTYAGNALLKQYVGQLPPIIQGNSVTPANVHVNIVAANTSAFTTLRTGSDTTSFSVTGHWIVKDMKLTSTRAALECYGAGNIITFSNIMFGACVFHILSSACGEINIGGAYSISGSPSTAHILSQNNGIVIQVAAYAATLLANITTATFAWCPRGGLIQLPSVWSISLGGFTVTGKRYLAELGGVINTTGGGASYFPGSIAGTTDATGTYDGATTLANKFIVQGVTDTGLSAAQFLGALATGIVKNTTTTGVLSIAAAGTDYVAPGGALGTPSSGTLTSCTGLPIASGVSGLGANVAAFLATPSSANLAAALTDETGSGANVFATGPTITGLKAYGNVYPLMAYGGKNFNGTTDYLDTNALTGIADGKVGTFACVVRFSAAAAATERILSNNVLRFSVVRGTTGNIAFQGLNAAAVSIMNLITSGNPCAAAGTYVILASWDLATPGTGRIYINDVSNALETTYTNDTIDYTTTEWSVGAAGTGTQFMAGDIYSLWFDATQRLEFNTEAVRRRFADANNVPVYLGSAGQLPTGTAPGLFLGYDDVNSWHINRGSFQTTSFTQNGAIASAATALSGQFAPLQDFGKTVTVTADYTVGRTDRLVIVNKGAACVLTLPDAALNQGRELRVLNIGGAFATTSASSNVVPMAGGAASTALLAATDGAGALLKANGTTWQIVDN